MIPGLFSWVGNTIKAVSTALANTWTALQTFSAGINLGQTNNLSYYDKGSFSPVLGGTVSDPTQSGTAVGKWWRIGDVVFFEARWSGATISGGSGNALMKGLPFTPNVNNYGAFVAGQPSGITVKNFVFQGGTVALLNSTDDPIALSSITGAFYVSVKGWFYV